MRLFRRKPLPSGDALFAEAKKCGVSQTGVGVDEAEIQRRVFAARAEGRAAVLSAVQTLGIIGSLAVTLGVAIWHGRIESKREAGDVMLKFTTMLYSGPSRVVTEALDNQGNLDSVPLEGENLDQAINNFLDYYDLLHDAYNNHLIDNQTTDDAFSYELEKGLKDPRIRDYLAKSRAKESDLFEGVFDLARALGIKFPPITPQHAPARAALTVSPSTGVTKGTMLNASMVSCGIATDLVLGVLASVIVTVFFEFLKHPSLRVSEAPRDDMHYGTGHKIARVARFIQVRVVNRKPLVFFRWLLSRYTALQCQAEISFFRLDGQKIFDMTGRWSGWPEPLALTGHVGGMPIQLVNPYYLSPEFRRVDIYPRVPRKLDIAVRFDDESECYGWTTENYQEEWRSPSRRLPQGTFLVKVTVYTDSKPSCGLFRLINDSDADKFRLSDASPGDWQSLSKLSRVPQTSARR
jgi:hypothetical protein